MRPAHLTLLKEQFEGAQTPGTMRMPRGLVFHLPPANVDTIFMYSWLHAALGGNRSVVRLSGKRGVAVDVMCDALNDAMAEPGSRGLASSLRVVAYGHDANVTAAISARADVRVIWGGDSTVRQIREIPLPPRSIELTFADRFSLAAVEATAYLHADPHRRSQLAEDFVSDIFPFDQAACSSPQLVAWCGPESDVAQASETFFSEVATVAGRRGYSVDAGTATAQTLAAAALAADHGVRWCRRYGRELLVVEINGPADLVRNTVGGGYLLSVRLNDLLELAPYLNRADQTLTQFGFSDAKLRDFARRAAGSGGDRSDRARWSSARVRSLLGWIRPAGRIHTSRACSA